MVNLGVKDFLDRLAEKGLVEIIEDPLRTYYEIPLQISKVVGEKALLFKRPVRPDGKEYECSVVSGLCGDKRRVRIGLKTDDIAEKVLNGLENPLDPVPTDSDREIVIENPNLLRDLPILKHYDCEPGPYITGGVISSKSPEGYNTFSFHRMLVIGRNKLAVRIVEGRELHRSFTSREKEGKPLDVSISIGLSADLLIAAATPVRKMDKISLAGGIRGESVRVSKCETVDAVAPEEAEIVLEGRILPGERADEGPFYEILGVDKVRKQPVIEVLRISMRRNPYYYGILPASCEQEDFMGMAWEALILKEFRKYARVKGVSRTPAGSGWIEVAISIEKEFDEQPLQVALAAINAHSSLKSVIIVDEDVNVEDYIEVMKAVLQRAYPPMDYHILRNVRGSTIEHSEKRFFEIDGEKKLVKLPKSKVIIDATVKGPKQLFSKCRIPC